MISSAGTTGASLSAAYGSASPTQRFAGCDDGLADVHGLGDLFGELAVGRAEVHEVEAVAHSPETPSPDVPADRRKVAGHPRLIEMLAAGPPTPLWYDIALSVATEVPGAEAPAPRTAATAAPGRVSLVLDKYHEEHPEQSVPAGFQAAR